MTDIRSQALSLALFLPLVLAQAIPPPPPPPLQGPARDQPSPAAMGTGTASISGQITVDDASGAPLRRAVVTLTSGNVYDARVTVTDDRGRFTFTNLPAGRFTLAAQRPGYVVAYYGSKHPGTSTGSTAIAVADGQQVTDLRMSLLKGAVLTGTIRDASGQPAVDIAVVAQHYVYNASAGARVLVSASSPLGEQTDDRGVYRIFGLPPGDYVVQAFHRELPMDSGAATRQMTREGVAWAAGQLQANGPASAPPASARGRAVGSAPVYYPGTPLAADATTITLKAGEERSGVDFAMQLVSTATVDGVVRGSEGPVPNVLVMMVATDRVGASLFSNGLKRATTDRNGAFSFTGVTPGTYGLTARSAPPAPPRGRGAGSSDVVTALMSSPAAVGAQFAVDEVTVNGSDTTVTLVLEPGKTVSGKVVFHRTALDPPDPATTSVNLTAIVTGGVTAGVPNVHADASGAFTVSGVAPGRYRLSASTTAGNPTAPNHWAIESATLNGRDVLDTPLEVTPDADVNGLVVTFTDTPSELDGALRDASGRAAPDYFVIAFSADRQFWTPQSRRVRMARPGVDGRFRLQDLPPGDYLLAAVTDVEQGEWYDPSFLAELAAASPVHVTVGAGEKKVQDLRIGGQ